MGKTAAALPSRLTKQKDNVKEFLNDIITEAGRISLDYKTKLAGIRIDRKSPKDLCTEADIAIEKYLTSRIKKASPAHGILGEEFGKTEGNEYLWIIDPIDGTTSFIHDQPFYSVSVGLHKNGQPLLAAVNAPVLGEFFTAEKGKGSFLNGKPIKVSRRDDLMDCVLGTGFACLRSDNKLNNVPYFNSIIHKILGIRRFGSAAIDLCYVACGRLDGFWELNLHIYDIAAGALILSEAGGKITDFGMGETNIPSEVLATNSKI